MGQKTKRWLNAAILGFIGTLLLQVIDHYQEITTALNDGNWVWLRAFGVSLLGGAVLGLLRAAQSYIGPVPSPEKDEAAP